MSKPDKRSEILQAALELLTEQGFHGAPMAQIASHAGVAAGTIYCYFQNREELIRELLLDIEGRITAQVQEVNRADLPIRHRFSLLCAGVLDYFVSHPLEFKYLEQFHNSPYGAELRRDRIFGKPGEQLVVCDLFMQGISEGVIKNLPLSILTALTFGPLLVIARDHILGFCTLDADLRTQVVDACWDAVKR